MKAQSRMAVATASESNPRPGMSRVALLAACAIAASLAGCKHLSDEGGRVAGWALIDASQRHPIIVSQKPSTMNLHVARGSSGLNPHQRAQVLEFAARYRASDTGDSRLIVQAPSGGTNEVSSMRAVHEVRRLLEDEGFPESSIAVEAYPASGGHEPVRVSYMRYVADAPECGAWPTNLARDPSNVPYANFGCATQRNLAMQVANPGDLLGPRTLTSRSAERRDVTFEKYVKGDVTSAKKSEDERVTTQGGK